MEARTAAYGSAYCMVRLTMGPPKSGSGRIGGALGCDLAGEPEYAVLYPWVDVPNPLGAGSEKAP